MPISFNAEALRKASDVDHFPYRAAGVTFLLIKTDGIVVQAGGIGEKRAMLSGIGEGDLLLAAWTGRYRTDIFFVDPQIAAASVG